MNEQGQSELLDSEIFCNSCKEEVKDRYFLYTDAQLYCEKCLKELKGDEE